MASLEIERGTDGQEASVDPFFETRIIPSILDLPEKLGVLREQKQELVKRFFEITKEDNSELVVPESMEALIINTFGNGRSSEETLNSIRHQKIVTVQDRHLKEEAVYNAERRKRPLPTTIKSSFEQDIADQNRPCPFCTPETSTPYSSKTGRPSRNKIVVVANLTKFAVEHTLALGRHNPYETTKEDFGDQIAMLLEWAQEESGRNPANRFLRIGLNRGYRAGGSLVHDHWQGELRSGSMHFPVAERLNEVAYYYQFSPDYKGADFLDDFFQAHQVLGLGVQRGDARVISMLVPPKEHGVMVIDNEQTKGFALSGDFIDALWDVQQFMMQGEGVREYNIFILPKPDRSDSLEYWLRYRPVAIFVDRGPSTTKNSDMGYAELSGTAVVSYDPFDFSPRLNEYLQSAASV